MILLMKVDFSYDQRPFIVSEPSAISYMYACMTIISVGLIMEILWLDQYALLEKYCFSLIKKISSCTYQGDKSMSR